jgi:hypothetical protein
MGRRRIAALIAVVAVLAAITTSASSAPALCTDQSTPCLESAARSYIDALTSDDSAMADKVRAAPGVQRWENGVHNATNRAELVRDIKHTQTLVAGIRDVRLFAARSGTDVFAMYVVDGGLTKQLSVTSHVIEHFEVRHGEITSLDVVECMGGPGEQSRPRQNSGEDFALCARGPRVFL